MVYTDTMQSSLFSEGGTLVEERALQLALELSLLGLGEPVGAPQSPPLPFCQQSALDDRAKKSQNMTECVPVPSSEHVAEIVGRQGKGSYSLLIIFQFSWFAPKPSHFKIVLPLHISNRLTSHNTVFSIISVIFPNYVYLYYMGAPHRLWWSSLCIIFPFIPHTFKNWIHDPPISKFL